MAIPLPLTLIIILLVWLIVGGLLGRDLIGEAVKRVTVRNLPKFVLYILLVSSALTPVYLLDFSMRFVMGFGTRLFGKPPTSPCMQGMWAFYVAATAGLIFAPLITIVYAALGFMSITHFTLTYFLVSYLGAIVLIASWPCLWGENNNNHFASLGSIE